LQIEKKLNQLGGEVIYLDEMASIGAGSEFALPKMPELHWEFGQEMLNAVPSALARYHFDAGIEISSFQCGCDAVIKGYVEDAFRARKIPFLYLIIDEQTGEAGYQTRLEAFCDTVMARS
jgi:predicted nucleotide-binding protein (sugar kinase/HSP70/actin superfamily)